MGSWRWEGGGGLFIGALQWRRSVGENQHVCVCARVWKVEELERKVIDSQLIAAADIVLKDTLKCTLGPMVWKSEGARGYDGRYFTGAPRFRSLERWNHFFFSPFIQN